MIEFLKLMRLTTRLDAALSWWTFFPDPEWAFRQALTKTSICGYKKAKPYCRQFSQWDAVESQKHCSAAFFSSLIVVALMLTVNRKKNEIYYATCSSEYKRTLLNGCEYFVRSAAARVCCLNYTMHSEDKCFQTSNAARGIVAGKTIKWNSNFWSI
jgi:hypothetical protein